mmetsp:Transcript_26821/g.61744  ORF Transcript_26821/g.61744 Transcript_26821/m.61744 type:complete len:129 (+) Transcript_26821:750-1136(+)
MNLSVTSPFARADATTTATTATVEAVPTAERYDKRRGVFSKMVGKASKIAKIVSWVLTEYCGSNWTICSPILTKKIARHENSSKYKTRDKKTAPEYPNVWRAISGNDPTGFPVFDGSVLDPEKSDTDL